MSIAKQADMAGKSIQTDWPTPRDFGWKLKETDATTFQIKFHPENDQMVVVLNQPMVRGGVTSEMIYWWFKHFANLKVRIKNVGNYSDGDVIPAYFLWHPFDHFGVTQLGVNDEGKLKVGSKFHIQEAMSFDKYERKYLMDATATIWYLRNGSYGGQGMGLKSPFGTWLMSSRICWEDVTEDGLQGVHYHYEITIGIANKWFGKWINPIIRNKKGMSNETFNEWNRHNVIEVGTFENFLPRLYEQRKTIEDKPTSEWILDYDAATDDTAKNLPTQTQSFDPSLVQKRIDGYMKSNNTHEYSTTTQALGDRFYEPDK